MLTCNLRIIVIYSHFQQHQGDNGDAGRGVRSCWRCSEGTPLFDTNASVKSVCNIDKLGVKCASCLSTWSGHRRGGRHRNGVYC
jgi:hypothetical protein